MTSFSGFFNTPISGTNLPSVVAQNVDFSGSSTPSAQVTANGQLLIGASSAPYIRVNTLTAGSGIAITNAAGSITIAATGAGFAWSDQSLSFTAAKENGYFTTAALTALLPAAPAEGDTVAFISDTTSVLTIQANGGQAVRLGSTISAVNGTAASTARGDSIELVYRSTGSVWIALSSVGNWSIT